MPRVSTLRSALAKVATVMGCSTRLPSPYSPIGPEVASPSILTHCAMSTRVGTRQSVRNPVRRHRGDCHAGLSGAGRERNDASSTGMLPGSNRGRLVRPELGALDPRRNLEQRANFVTKIGILPRQLPGQFRVVACRSPPGPDSWIPENPGEAPCLGQIPTNQKRAAVKDELHGSPPMKWVTWVAAPARPGETSRRTSPQQI